MPLPAGLQALGQRDYRIYYVGNLVAQIGTWMQTITQSWLVLQLTDSPLLLGLIATLQFGPILLLSVFTGVLADRVTRRSLLLTTQSVQGGLAFTLGLLVWSGRVAYWHVATMAVCWGVMSAIDQPARQSFVVELVGRERVASAVGLNSASFNSARIVGPAIAGLLIARLGLSPNFLLNALAFAVAILMLLQVPGRPPRPRATATTIVQDIAEAVAYALRTRLVRFVLGVQAIASFCIFNFTVYVPLLARNVLGQGAEGFGFLMTSLGIGAVVAGLSLGGLVSRRPPLAGIAVVLGGACLCLLGLSLVRQFWAAALLLALTGLTGILVVAGCNSFLQLTTPDALRGRVMSLYILLSSGIFPIGAFFVGFVSQHWGVSTAFAVNGTLGLLALALLRPWLPRGALA